jgi:hypothetical protein
MPVIAAGIISFMIGIFIGLIMGHPHDVAIYKKCRYYDQSIERCVAELGWEKK